MMMLCIGIGLFHPSIEFSLLTAFERDEVSDKLWL